MWVYTFSPNLQIYNQKDFLMTTQIHNGYQQISYPAQGSTKFDEKIAKHEITELIYDKATKDTEKTPLAKVSKAMPHLFTAGVVANFACRANGALSKKIAGGAVGAGLLLAVNLLFKGWDKLSEKIQPKSKDRENTNPVLKTVGTIAGIVAIAGLSVFAMTKGGKFISGTKNGQKAGAALKELGSKIDKSPIGTGVDKLRANYQKFCAKHPALDRNIFKHSFGLMFLSYICASLAIGTKLTNIKRQKAEENIKALDNYVNTTRKTMQNHIPQSDEECDSLVITTQREIIMANADLKNVNSGKVYKA